MEGCFLKSKIMEKSRVILFASVTIILTYLVVLFFKGSVTMADVYRGYEAMHQFQNGGEWNVLHYPSIEYSEYNSYISWWAPAHWVIPWLLISCGIQSIQSVQFIIITAALLVSIIGYYRLFKSLNFSIGIVSLSILCIVTNYTFYWHSIMYHGGELFLLAILPYFVYFLLNIQSYTLIKRGVYFALFSVLGLFLKNTFFILLICAGIFLLINQENKSIKERLSFIWPLLLIFLATAIPFFILHLRLGETPSTAVDLEGYFGIPNTYIGDLTYSFGSPIGILTRFDFLAHGINAAFFDHLKYFNWFQLLPFAFMALFYIRSFKLKAEPYHAFLVYFCLPFFCAFTIFYIQDKAVSYEMRHFASVGFLFFPGIIQWLKEIKFSKNLMIVLLLLCAMDVGIYTQQVKNVNRKSEFWNDLKLPHEDVKILKAIQDWDKIHANSIILLEDYWQLSIGESQNDKMVVAIDETKMRVVSGMELDFPEYVQDIKKLIERYEYVLLVGRIDSDVKPALGYLKWNLSISTERFQIQSASLK